MNLRLLDKKHFGRQGEAEDVIVGDSADSYLTDARGRKYIDFMMGWCVGNLGWGNTEIRAAARKFDGPDYVHPDVRAVGRDRGIQLYFFDSLKRSGESAKRWPITLQLSHSPTHQLSFRVPPCRW